MKIDKSHEIIAALVSQRLYYWHQQINGHFRNRFFGGTDSIYIYIYIYIFAYFSGLNFREYPQNSYGLKYGTFTYLHQLDPETNSEIQILMKYGTKISQDGTNRSWVIPIEETSINRAPCSALVPVTQPNLTSVFCHRFTMRFSPSSPWDDSMITLW